MREEAPYIHLCGLRPEGEEVRWFSASLHQTREECVATIAARKRASYGSECVDRIVPLRQFLALEYYEVLRSEVEFVRRPGDDE